MKAMGRKKGNIYSFNYFTECM